MNAQVKLLLCRWMLARDFSHGHPLAHQKDFTCAIASSYMHRAMMASPAAQVDPAKQLGSSAAAY